MMQRSATSNDSALQSKQDDESDGQWTRVIRKGHGRGRPAQVPDLLRPPPAPSDGLTLQQIEAEHTRTCSQWRSRSSHGRLEELVRSQAVSHSPVTQAICLGSGSFDPRDGIRDKMRRAHIQTDAFLSIVNTLSECSGRAIPSFFQEPDYTEVDKSLLEGLGHNVVETPAAFDMVNQTSLVYGIHLYKKEYAQLLATSLPAMLVGTTWNRWEETLQWDPVETPSLDRLRDIHETYDKYDFPREKDDHTFSDTCIYWKKAGDGQNPDIVGSKAQDSLHGS